MIPGLTQRKTNERIIAGIEFKEAINEPDAAMAQTAKRGEGKLKEKQSVYGLEIVVTLSKPLAVEYRTGFSKRNLFNMIRFAEIFPAKKIARALSAQLIWTHFRKIIYLDNNLQNNFYAEMWNTEQKLHRTVELAREQLEVKPA